MGNKILFLFRFYLTLSLRESFSQLFPHLPGILPGIFKTQLTTYFYEFEYAPPLNNMILLTIYYLPPQNNTLYTDQTKTYEKTD